MARGEVRAVATRTSPRNKEVRTRTNGVALQVTTQRSKAAKKRKKVSTKNPSAVSAKRTKTNDTVHANDDKPVEDPVDDDDGVIANKKKRVAGAGNKRKSFQPKKALVMRVPQFIESSSESEEYIDKEEDDMEDDEEEEVHEEEQDAVQESSDDDGQKEPADENEAANNEQHDSSSSSSEEDNSREHCQRNTEYQKEMNAEAQAAGMRAEDRRKESNRSAQKGAAHPPNNANPNAMLSSARQIIDVGITVRGLSKAESLQKQEKHVANRVIQFVKSDLFRRIKFINNDAMFQKAFLLVMNNEKVEPHKRVSFQMLYESCFNHALNTKRSSCEQAGGILVKKAVAEFQRRGEAFYSIDEFCKLRRATTEREKSAFFWFFDTFLECVCGAIPWRNGKKAMLVSKADDGHRGKLVTKSDEAFALLLIDNYMEKWIKALEKEGNPSTDTVADDTNDNDDNDNNTGEVGTNAKQKKKAMKRMPGKYTAKKNGHCKYGGWSREGTARFNELYNLVQEDRASPQAEQMESELMAYCRARAGIDDGNAQGEQGGPSDNDALEGSEALVPVEAAWDLDD